MSTKHCGAGKHDVDESLFHKRGNGLQPNCRDCQNAINRTRYAGNKETHIKHVRRNKRERIDRFAAWKKTLQCSLCPETFSRCLDFHHLDPSHKDFGIAEQVRETSIEKMKEELRKCAVVCKNCHVKVHEGAISGKKLKPLTEKQLGCWQSG